MGSVKARFFLAFFYLIIAIYFFLCYTNSAIKKRHFAEGGDSVERQLRRKALLEIKKIIEEDKNGDKFLVIQTSKNRELIRELGLRFVDIKDIIKDLCIEDCWKGPEIDRNPHYSGPIYIFLKDHCDKKLYIKIRIESKKKAICLSFHEEGKFE